MRTPNYQSQSTTNHFSMAAKVEADYGRVAATDPLFAPHASLAFESLGELGKGGMGTVLKVRDRRCGRLAALKLLNDPQAGEKAERRFLREANLTAKLDHPCIPPVYEIGRTANGQSFLLMRLIEGRTLEQEIDDYHKQNRPATELRRLLQILIKVAEALAYAHSQEIIHRDLKPANIMVGRFGEVLLMDWGVAKQLGHDHDDSLENSAFSKDSVDTAGLTVTGGVVGTPGYMSPEQARGEDIDERSDVYALGLLLGEILIGSPLVRGGSSLIRTTANASGQFKTLSEAGIKAPRTLQWILTESLALEVNQRTANAGEFLDQLTAFLSDQIIPDYHYSIGEKTTRFIKQKPATVMGLFLGILLLVLGGFLNEAWRNSAHKDLQLSEAQIQEAKAKEEALRALKVLKLFNEARNLARKGLTEKLDGILKQALNLAKRDRESLVTAAKIAEEAGQNKVARQLLEETAKNHPPAYEALYQLHLLENDSPDDRMTLALKTLLQRAKKHGVTNEFSLFAAGNELMNRKDYKAAIKTYTEVEQYSRRLTKMYGNRGLARSRTGDLEGALEDYNKAISINPKNFVAYFNRARLWSKAKKKIRALQDYNKCIELNPKHAGSYNLRAFIRQKFKDYNGALMDLNKAMTLGFRGAKIHHARANLLREMKKYKLALKDFDKALEIDPKHIMSHLGRGLVLVEQKKPKQALRAFDTFLKLAPRDRISPKLEADIAALRVKLKKLLQ